MNNWKEILLPHTATIEDSLTTINASQYKIALVIDEQERLIGTITDGDIRRSLLKHIPISATVNHAMNGKPQVILISDSEQQVLQLLEKIKGQIIPILNTNRQVIGIKDANQLTHITKNDTPVVIMAGGLGTRLGALTEKCPKPMLKINDTPLLEININRFAQYGFNNIFISVNYKADMIKNYFGNGEQWGVNIQYIEEKNALGTAGALSLIPNLHQYKSYIVTNGDVMTQINYESLLNYHIKNQSSATVCVQEHEHQIPYGVIDVEQYLAISITEKPVKKYFTSTGIYVIDSDVITTMPKHKRLDMPDFLNQLITKKNQVRVFPIHEYWLDIGQIADFKQAQIDYPRLFNMS